MTQENADRTPQNEAAPWTEAASRKAPLTAEEAEAMGIGGNPKLGQEGERHANNDNDEPLSEGEITFLEHAD